MIAEQIILAFMGLLALLNVYVWYRLCKSNDEFTSGGHEFTAPHEDDYGQPTGWGRQGW